MSIENARDPRAVLVREKYFTLRPKPLERWLWQQSLPQAAERVFWLHWEEGMRRGDWCSEISLKQVARECCVDTSTVTRAYQVLKGLELIRREDPGRDPQNPFQQAIAITEVRVPRELLMQLGRSPNRPHRPSAAANAAAEPHGRANDIIQPQREISAQAASPAAAAPQMRLTREESSALMRKLSDTERGAFFVASRDRRTAMPFDEATKLSAEERGRVLEILTQVSTEMPKAAEQPQRQAPIAKATEFAKPRQLSTLEAARLRKRIGELVPAGSQPEIFSQVLWSVEEGALRRFSTPLAINTALKKIREGAWSRPNRMPPNWLRAVPETCSAA
jgi:hypothetical protein